MNNPLERLYDMENPDTFWKPTPIKKRHMKFCECGHVAFHHQYELERDNDGVPQVVRICDIDGCYCHDFRPIDNDNLQ